MVIVCNRIMILSTQVSVLKTFLSSMGSIGGQPHLDPQILTQLKMSEVL